MDFTLQFEQPKLGMNLAEVKMTNSNTGPIQVLVVSSVFPHTESSVRGVRVGDLISHVSGVAMTGDIPGKLRERAVSLIASAPRPLAIRFRRRPGEPGAPNRISATPVPEARTGMASPQPSQQKSQHRDFTVELNSHTLGLLLTERTSQKNTRVLVVTGVESSSEAGTKGVRINDVLVGMEASEAPGANSGWRLGEGVDGLVKAISAAPRPLRLTFRRLLAPARLTSAHTGSSAAATAAVTGAAASSSSKSGTTHFTFGIIPVWQHPCFAPWVALPHMQPLAQQLAQEQYRLEESRQQQRQQHQEGQADGNVDAESAKGSRPGRPHNQPPPGAVTMELRADVSSRAQSISATKSPNEVAAANTARATQPTEAARAKAFTCDTASTCGMSF